MRTNELNAAVLSRRSFGLGVSALALAGCSTGSAPLSSSRAQVVRAAPKAVPSPAFDAWVEGFKRRAVAKGVSNATIQSAMRNVGYLPDAIERDQNQFQTRRSLEDYIAIATTDERVAGGRTNLRKYDGLLKALQAKYGVPAEIIVAIWGVESRYGERRGEYPVISALATLGFGSRRSGFFEGQLVAALKILQRGETTVDKMTGSWAGAMGHTQFIPSTFLAYAVDFNGDNRRDVWQDDPTDALASAAAYLSRSGWVRGVPWGFEARVPSTMSPAKSSKSASRRSMGAWAEVGVRRADGSALPSTGSAALIRPNGATGPSFLIQRNFNTLLRYNNADKYLIAVGHLSDRILGKPGFSTKFPADAHGLSLADRVTLQRRLNAKGYDVGAPDGVLGDKTAAAIRAYQAKSKLPITGVPTQALLARLG